ncbi:hypothetical protein [Saccharibacillus deserti]|uniref:hypothetical protein n=1 Tax=Saccharibacillus deserti TaxID=1634444 RepID=UPI00155814E8|nr:hypothetical protein [Saccharibacillus deserti]
MEGILLIVLFVVNIPLVNLLSRILFRDRKDMEQAVKDTYRPGWSLNHAINESQVMLMVALCAIAIVGEYVLIMRLFDWLGITG